MFSLVKKKPFTNPIRRMFGQSYWKSAFSGSNINPTKGILYEEDLVLIGNDSSLILIKSLRILSNKCLDLVRFSQSHRMFWSLDLFLILNLTSLWTVLGKILIESDTVFLIEVCIPHRVELIANCMCFKLTDFCHTWLFNNNNIHIRFEQNVMFRILRYFIS